MKLIDLVVPANLLIGPVGGRRYPAVGIWMFNPSDPLVISLWAYQGHADQPWTEWSIYRDLLWVGITKPIGNGDVTVSPSLDDGSEMVLRLSSPDGVQVVGCPTECVRRALTMADGFVYSWGQAESRTICSALEDELREMGLTTDDAP